MQSRLSRSAYRSRVIDVLAKVSAEINPRNNQVGRLGQKPVQRNNNRVRWRTVYSPLPLPHAVANNWLAQSKRLRRAALFSAGRHDADRRKSFEPRSESLQSCGVNPIVISQQNMRHRLSQSQKSRTRAPAES